MRQYTRKSERARGQWNWIEMTEKTIEMSRTYWQNTVNSESRITVRSGRVKTRLEKPKTESRSSRSNESVHFKLHFVCFFLYFFFLLFCFSLQFELEKDINRSTIERTRWREIKMLLGFIYVVAFLIFLDVRNDMNVLASHRNANA